MASEVSLARLIREYGDRWVIEHMEGAARWVAVRRDGDEIRVIGGHDLGSLRYRLGVAEREELSG